LLDSPSRGESYKTALDMMSFMSGDAHTQLSKWRILLHTLKNDVLLANARLQLSLRIHVTTVVSDTRN
jgi:hypothetical protein